MASALTGSDLTIFGHPAPFIKRHHIEKGDRLARLRIQKQDETGQRTGPDLHLSVAAGGEYARCRTTQCH